MKHKVFTNTIKINNIMRKRILIILTAVLLTATVWAQSPEKISYQALVRDAGNNLVTNQSVGMQISILQSTASGTAVYVETQSPATNANGLVSLEIGNGTVVTGNFATIDWAAGPYFIKTEIDPSAEGGTNYTITGTSQLMSVPYAFHAKMAETISEPITETDPVYSASEAINITASDITNLGNLSGTNTGDQDLSTLATKTALNDSAAQVRSEIPDVSGLLTTETDPVYSTSVAAGITTTDTANWNNKLDATSIPGGIIVMWSGTIDGIPGGWALCDGTNGTPDLSGRFIVSYDAGNPDYNSIGNAAGADTYTLTQAQLPSHNHGGTITTSGVGSHNHTGYTGYEGSHTHNSGDLTGRMRGRDNDAGGTDRRGPVMYDYDSFDQMSSSSSVVISGTTARGSDHRHTISYAGGHNHSVTIGNTGSNAQIDNRPLYYTLAFIMKQ